MTYETILYEQDGAVATITMNRPEKRNALSRQLRDELEEGWTRAARDDAVSVIVIKAAGPDFSAGMDMFSGEARTTDTAIAQQEVLELQERWLRLRDVPKPTIAQVHGHCIALATQICVCCDLVVAAEDARIGVPVMPNDWYADWWVYRVGAQRAKLMNFTVGSTINGREAVDWGFAVRAFPAARLDEETQRLARWIAQTPLQVLRLKKQAINQVEDLMGFRTAARYTAGQNILVARSDASREVSAYTREHGLQATRERFAPPGD